MTAMDKPSDFKSAEFSEVLLKELKAITLRREVNKLDDCGSPTIPNDTAPLHDHYGEARKSARDHRLVGLAFSGGGIRSATIGLGFLQALAGFQMLKHFDYLSSVSGGGYIAGWLAAWIKRDGNMLNVQKQLEPSRQVNSRADRLLKKGLVVDDEPEPILHLREHSNYLTPKAGLMTADSWALIAIYVRNLFLNLLFVVPAAMALTFAARLVLRAYCSPGSVDSVKWASIADLLCTTCVLFTFGLLLPTYLRRSPKLERGKHRINSWLPVFQFLVRIALIGAACTTIWLVAPAGELGIKARGDSPFGVNLNQLISQLHCCWILSVFGGGYAAVGFVADLINLWLLPQISRRPSPHRLGRTCLDVLARFVAGVFFALMLIGISIFSHNLHFGVHNKMLLIATIGPALLLVAFVLTVALENGLLGGWLTEGDREWWSAITGDILRCAAVWVVVFALVVYAPIYIPNPTSERLTHRILGSSLVVGWISSAVGGALLGSSSRTPVQRLSRLPIDWLAKIAAWVFLIGLIVAAAFFSAHLLPFASMTCDPTLGWYEQSLTGNEEGRDFRDLGIALLVSIVIALTAGSIVNVNLFSLHSLYANRLIRCYLGASRPKSRWLSRDWTPSAKDGDWMPDPPQHPTIEDWGPGHGGVPGGTPQKGEAPRRENILTGFDAEDDIQLRFLQISESVDSAGGKPYSGPVLLVNTALNLVGGDELAWQERKAESFTLSPYYCGSGSTGYALASGAEELTLGRALAISGAAASPNMGYHSYPPLTALMTIFNVRLGWWMKNPSKDKPNEWNAGSPTRGGRLFDEIFGKTNEKGRYVYLSDGGHFENLGVYELVRRRCRYIVVCDASADPNYEFADLGNLIRKVRTDFGIRIEIDTNPLLPQGDEMFSRWHCAVGAIRYEDVDQKDMPGVLVYVKASLTGDEPADVMQYAQRSPTFPHETTADQFFSESQFESYRALGYHMGERVFQSAQQLSDSARLFANVHSRWFPPPPRLEENFFEAMKGIEGIHTQLRDNPLLSTLMTELYPENFPPNPAGVERSSTPQTQAEICMVNSMLQVMQNVWLRMRLDEYSEHPINSGWMNLFRRWTDSDIVNRHWPAVRGHFSKDFVRFCTQELKLVVYDIFVESLKIGDLSNFAGSSSEFVENTAANVSELLRTEEAIRHIKEYFYFEWFKEAERGRDLSYYINPGDVTLDSCKKPLAWIIWIEPAGGGGKYPAGIICLRRTPGTTSAELLVWLRGPYRNLGIGRDSLVTEMSPDGTPFHQKASDPRNSLESYICRQAKEVGVKTIQVRYPSSGGSDSQIDRQMWTHFFYQYGYRNIDGDESEILLQKDLG